MPAGLSLREAVRMWEQKTGLSPNETTDVNLMCQLPTPIDRLDESINQFLIVEKLTISTNAIERFVPMPKLQQLKILSLGRNALKRIQYLDDLAGTLEQLWLSYNQIDKLDNLQNLQKLHTLLIANNKIKNWDEVAKLSANTELKIVMLVGNPIYTATQRADNWPMVVRRAPQIESIDGVMVSAQTRNAAENLQE